MDPHVQLLIQLSSSWEAWQALWSNQTPQLVEDQHGNRHCLSQGATVKVAATADEGSALPPLPGPSAGLGF